MISLSHSPCCLQSFPDPETIIVGTYDYDESSSNSNHRKGSLCFIRERKLLLQHECLNGGIFGLELLSPENHLILAAHADGSLLLYSVTDDYDEVRILSQIRVITANSSALLTCLKAVAVTGGNDSSGLSHLIVTGSSEGEVSLIHLFKDFTFKKSCTILENESRDPVWTVDILKDSKSDSCIIFTGSDACQWKMFSSTQFFIKTPAIHMNRDCDAGVTFINFINTDKEMDNDYISGEIRIGSYDEKMRIYVVEINGDDYDVKIKGKFRSYHLHGAGVWRIREYDDHQQLLIAGMYSGVHWCDVQTNQIVSKKIGDGELIYDVIRLADGSFVTASFYEKMIQFHPQKFLTSTT